MVKLTRPTPSTNYVRGYGANGGQHKGDDWGWQNYNPTLTQRVLAAAPGTVVSVTNDGGYNQGWGNRVRIQHAPNVYTTYNHLETGQIYAKVGQKVVTGTHIANMGNTGRSFGDHLHHELEIGGWGAQFRVDPQPYYKKDLPGTASKPAPAGTLKPYQRKVKNLGSAWLNGRAAPSSKAAWKQKLESNSVADFDGWKRGEKVTIGGTTSDIWLRGRYAKNWFSAAGLTSQSTSGLTDLNPKKPAAKPPVVKTEYWDIPKAGQYYYNHYNNALNGASDRSQLIPYSAKTPRLRVLENPKTGPVKVNWNGKHVWVGTRRYPAKTVRA
jgi:hypothetical protein